MTDAQRYPLLTLNMVDRDLIARLDKAANTHPLNQTLLEEKLRLENFSNLFFDESARDQLLAAALSNQSYSIQLGRIQDASIEIKISSNKKQAIATVTPALGGTALTPDKIIEETLLAGVANDTIIQTAVQSLIEGELSATIALEIDALPGHDAQLVAEFAIDNERFVTIDEHDIADYFETKRYVTSQIGDLLMTRIPPTLGTDGLNVVGKILKAKKGKDLKFKKYKGSAVSTEDENLLIAEIAGHPVLEIQGVKVDDTLVLTKADLASGNITFDGSVVINGDVSPQVKICATGDIFIKGTVENATIDAGHNLIIGGGVISESMPETEEPPKITSRLTSGQDLHAKFLNFCDVKSNGSMNIQEYLMQCETEVEHHLLVGEKGGKGLIVGGHLLVGKSVTANVLGSVAYIRTEISCGRLKTYESELAALGRLISKRSREKAQLLTIFTKITAKDNPQLLGKVVLDKARKIKNTIAVIERILTDSIKQQQELEAALKNAQQAYVIAEKNLYPNCAITLNGENYTPEEERLKTRVSLRNNKLFIE